MLVGHKKQWEFLKKSAELNRISHAYLFSGQSQLGKRTVAREFTKLLFCQKAPHHFSRSSSDQTNFAKSGGGCQICRSCQDIQIGIHPDFIQIQPEGIPSHNVASFNKTSEKEESRSKKEIRISQIRDLIRKLFLKSALSPFKVAIIDEAHRLNSEAQNCFLKTLEEPKGKTILILITEYPQVLFPTILSRVQEIKFTPVSQLEIENYLQNQGCSLEKSQEISFISAGKLGLAINFFQNPDTLQKYEQKIREIDQLKGADLIFRFQYVKSLVSQKENIAEILNIWLRYFRAILLEKIKKTSRHGQYSVHKLKGIINIVERIYFLLERTNANQRLALEQIMLEL